MSRRIVLLDEINGYPASAGNEGDQIKLAIMRSEMYWNRKIVMGSTPTNKGADRIAEAFEQTDQRRYFVPCPHCGEFQFLKWGGKDAPFGIKWPEGEPERAYYVCEHNGCIIQHSEKFDMIERGEWRATSKSSRPGLVGFHIWAAYSYSPNGTWGALATEFLDCKGNPLKLKTFVNTILGESWEEASVKLSDHELENRARAEEYDADPLPEGVIMLTAGTDTQKDRLETEIVGWGLGDESWSVEFIVTYGNPDLPDVWRMHDTRVLDRIFSRADGVRLQVARCLVDTAGANTAGVYDAIKARQHTGRMFGAKGQPGEAKPLVGAASKTNAGKIPLFPIGTITAKDLVYGRLAIEEPGPGYCHFPARYVGTGYFKGLTSEKVVTHYRNGFPMREYVKNREGIRNEPLDCRVLAVAAYYSMGIKIDDLVAQAQTVQNDTGRRLRGTIAPSG